MRDVTRRVLPGGATLTAADERAVACRPLAVVVERVAPTPPPPAEAPDEARPPVARSRPSLSDRLGPVKLALEVVALALGVVGAIAALFSGWRK